MVLPRDLVARHRAGRLVPFVGAGVSKAVRRRGSAEPLFPTWPELLRSATDLLEAEQVDIRQLLQSPNANLQEIATDAALLDDLIRVQLLFENSTIEHYVICRTAESAVVRGLLEQRGLDAGVITVEDFGEPLIRALEEIEEASASTQSTDSSQVTIDRKANSVPRLPLRRRCRTVPDSFGDLDPALPRAFSEGHTLDDHAVLLKAARRSQSSLATALSQATVLEFDGAIELMALELGNVQFLGMEEAYRRLFRGIAFEKLKQFDEAIADYDWIQRNVPDDDELVTCAAFNRMICLEKLGDYSAASFGRWIGDRDRVLRPGDLLWTKAFNMELVRAARAQQRTDHEDVLPLALEAEQASCPAGYAKTVINWSIYQGTDLGDDVVYDILRVAGSQPVNTSTGILHHCQTFAERTGDTILENAIRSAFDAALVRSRESATVERFLHQ